ncbi:HEPN-associated N-terminal domain-containing protein [Streptomyces sp. NPDC056227]|uniref:HEPN-associated N-terminal domain-containing protein n=1 Tax=Streptomyces sp. NPDC056227 TaxID=3345753 RepID=UPI0035DF7EF7
MGTGDALHAQWEQGWRYTDDFVCADCVDDEALSKALRAAQEDEQQCSFCQNAPAAELDALMEAFFNGMSTEYADALDEGAYFEGELAALRSWDGQDLVDEYAEVFRSEALHTAVRNAAGLDQVWVERDFIAPRHDQALQDGWERFCEQVMYKTRYVFWMTSREDDEQFLGAGEVAAADILHSLGAMIPDVGLVHELPAGHRLWRARTHTTPDVDWGARDLGTASPLQATQHNRMSPAGIPLFYAADEPNTAISEVARHTAGKASWVTCAAFETTQPCTIVDFTRLGPVPSLFDPDNSHLRRTVMFLRSFVTRLSASCEGREHLEYVPTQIVTEYLLRVFRQDQPVAGLAFTSAAHAAGGGACVVLDVPQERCLASEESPGSALGVRLVPGSLRTTRLSP